MLRGGPQASAQDYSKQQQQQQKQKKRLSFRDPEVEGPKRDSFYTGCRSKTLGRPTKITNTRKISSSVEDLTLEDQALQIAHHVGSAFSDLTATENQPTNFLDSSPSNIERETDITDSSPSGFEPYSRSCQSRTLKISAEDQEYLGALVPPLQDLTMRDPTVENNDANSTKNCIPTESSFHEARPSSSTQHQLQLLKYQLDQQNQQTQMAMHQVQLLQDQMEAESVARRKAQEQNNQLMQQNKELLNHVEKLFQQIEELEKQVQLQEHEKRSKRTVLEPQVTSSKQPTSYLANRRPSSEQTLREKPMLQARSQIASATKRTSLTPTKPLVTTSKASTSQNSSTSASTTRKPSVMPQRTYSIQSKSTDSGTKVKETLRIGDSSPPVQSGTANPFNSGWKLKSPESTQSATDKMAESANRGRAGSFSSFMKKPQEGSTSKSTLFSSTNSGLSSTGITNKKYSSSTSDLYNTPSTTQGKSSLLIEEPSTSVKSAVSNLSLSTSKLPRYQPYTGWQRRTSLTNDNEPISAISKDSYKTSTSLFNR